MKTFFLKLFQTIKRFLHLSVNPARVDPPVLNTKNSLPIVNSPKLPEIRLGRVDAMGDEYGVIDAAVVLLNHVMATESFKEKVLAADFTETTGLTNQQIYDKLCNTPVTINVNVYTGNYVDNHINHTIGYETEPGTVNINRHFVGTAYEFADNIIHEAEGHSQGFSHNDVYMTSVPYTLNRIFEAVCKELGVIDA